MNRETLRELARNRWPVVQMETGAHGEIVYPYIREIKVVYASPDELRAGFPRERLAVVLADRSGRSFTETGARMLRLPTDDEARAYAPLGVDLNAMAAGLAGLRLSESKS